ERAESRRARPRRKTRGSGTPRSACRRTPSATPTELGEARIAGRGPKGCFLTGREGGLRPLSTSRGRKGGRNHFLLARHHLRPTHGRHPPLGSKCRAGG